MSDLVIEYCPPIPEVPGSKPDFFFSVMNRSFLDYPWVYPVLTGYLFTGQGENQGAG